MNKKTKVFLIVMIFIFFVGQFFISTNSASAENLNSKKVNDKFNELKLILHDYYKYANFGNYFKKEFEIVAAGDILFHMPQLKSAYNEKESKYDFKKSFDYVKEIVENSDFSFANFETTISDAKQGYSGFPLFSSPIETLEAIKYAGFELLCTANNHSLDRRQEGVYRTLDAIEKNGFMHVGTYRSLDERKPVIYEKGGMRIGVLAYTYGANGMEVILNESEKKYLLNFIDEERIREDIEELKGQEVDMIVSFMHWGNEYTKTLNEQQIYFADKLTDLGVDIILGSHPHWVQESEIKNKRGLTQFVIYSLGNFISNQRAEILNIPYTEDGLMVKIKIEKDFIKNKTHIKDIKYIPTWVYCPIENGKKNYYILPCEDALDGKFNISFDEKTKNRIEKSYNDTIKTVLKGKTN